MTPHAIYWLNTVLNLTMFAALEQGLAPEELAAPTGGTSVRDPITRQ